MIKKHLRFVLCIVRHLTRGVDHNIRPKTTDGWRQLVLCKDNRKEEKRERDWKKILFIINKQEIAEKDNAKREKWFKLTLFF